MWERACSRRRQVSRHDCLLKDRLREQARSHRGCVSQRVRRRTGLSLPAAPDTVRSTCGPSRRR
ncbi:hypothetical protein C3E97_023800 [Pseudomonas sp. MWU12-2115]|nr:hypothetical protein C3E97_023800 [Pseudomonas sp. MWU12-2115]